MSGSSPHLTAMPAVPADIQGSDLRVTEGPGEARQSLGEPHQAHLVKADIERTAEIRRSSSPIQMTKQHAAVSDQNVNRPIGSSRSLRRPGAQAIGIAITALFAAGFSGVQAAQESQPADAQVLADLLAQEAQQAGNPDFDYALGVAALDAGHLSRAIFALERVLEVQPGHAQARAELGRAYLAAGDVARGRQELMQVRRGDLPPEAARAIDRVLGALDASLSSERQRKVTGYAEASLGRDSNVNSATNAGQFALPAFGGLLLTMAPEARQRSDVVAGAALGTSVQVPVSATWDLVAGANVRGTAPRKVQEMQTTVADLSVSATHTADDSSQTLAWQSSGAWLDGGRYRTAHGVAAQWQQQLNSTTQGNAFVQLSRQAYAGQSDRDTDRAVLGLALARAFDDGRRLAYGSVYRVRERPREALNSHFGHQGYGARLGAEQALGAATLFAEWQVERRHYGGTEPLFETQRHDRQSDWLAGLRWSINRQWQVLPQLRRTIARSNVVLYDYQKTVVQIAVRREF